ncbi:MAG: heme exporter protein CcmD [Methylococcales bacterium]
MTISEFFNMGGYGFYVWSSFGLTFVMLVWQIIQPLLEKNSIRRSIVKNYARRGQRQ